LNEPLEVALKAWLRILDQGQPRPILVKDPRPSDAVIFTDGSFEPEDPAPIVGGVMFAWWREAPVAFSCEVPHQLLATWLPRKNQIALVELFATVIAVAHFGAELAGRNVMFLVDSEPALDALVKGLSKFEDVIHLLTLFWHVVAEFQVNVYLDRVSTDANISDGISREDMSAFDDWGCERVFPDPIVILQEGPEAQACRPKGSRRARTDGGQGPKRRGRGRRAPADESGGLFPGARAWDEVGIAGSPSAGPKF
jgi:hypothetical protein